MVLTRNEINNLKFKYTDKYNNLSLLDLVKTIQDENFKIEISSFDAKYKYELKKNNKIIIENREENIIIFGNVENIKNIEFIANQEIFVDTTFKIIPKKFYPYKLMTISYLNENKVNIFCFVLYKYQDHINYERIFLYLKDNYNLNPKIVHTDYEKALYSIFTKDNIFKHKILHGFCFFHYIKSIREKMKKINVTSKKLNKKSYEILKNIEILSFIKKDNLQKYIKFINEELKKDSKYKVIVPYLQQNWFNKNSDMFNFANLIDYKKENNEGNKYLDKLYLTNNISESLHSKINFYLPKYTTSSQNFSESMIKVFLDDSIKIESIKRYDIKSTAIISIIEDLNLNTEAKWVKYETFKNYEFKLLKDNYKENSDLEINSLYKEINYDLDDEEEKNINNNNNKNIIIQDDKKENEDDLDLDEIDKSNNKNEIDINNEENEIKEEDVNDNEENNEECILNYNNFNLYKDITNNINNLNLNNEDSYIDVKVNEKNLDNRNSNNNIIVLTSLKPNKRKKKKRLRL